MFIILCQLFLFMSIVVNGQNFMPEPRNGQAAVLIEDKIYYIGGFTYFKLESTSDFFYFNLTGFYWTDLTTQRINMPLTIWHTASIGGINNDLIFIIGGTHIYETNTNYIYRFNTKTNAIDIPIIQGKAPIMPTGASSVSYEGKIYIFGGITDTGRNTVFLNNLDILDTINLNWQVGSLVNSPVARTYYTATLVNGVIYYIGGRVERDIYSPMSEIYQYDIVGNTWSLKTATAVDLETIPGSRSGHSAVLVLTSRILVYGGSYFNDDTAYDLPAKQTIVILDTNTLVWSIPNLDDDRVPKLFGHSAVVQFDTTMIIAFGNYSDKPNDDDQTNKSVFVFYFDSDIVKWNEMPLSSPVQANITNSKSQIPDLPGKSISDPSQTPSPNEMLIVCVSIGSVVVVLAILIALTLVYKRKKKITKEDKDPKDPII